MVEISSEIDSLRNIKCRIDKKNDRALMFHSSLRDKPRASKFVPLESTCRPTTNQRFTKSTSARYLIVVVVVSFHFWYYFCGLLIFPQYHNLSLSTWTLNSMSLVNWISFWRSEIVNHKTRYVGKLKRVYSKLYHFSGMISQFITIFLEIIVFLQLYLDDHNFQMFTNIFRLSQITIVMLNNV